MSEEAQSGPEPGRLRVLGIAVGGLTVAPAFSFGMLAFLVPLSWTARGISLALMAFCMGALTASVRIEKHRGVVRLSSLALILLVGGHLLAAGSGERLRLIALPGGETSSVSSRLVIERDVAELGASVTLVTGHIDFDEGWRLPEAMSDAYDRMADAEGVTPTPLIRTFMGSQRADDFDTAIIESKEERPEVGAIFLHGSGGNFVLNCWQASQAMDAVGAITACPSMGWRAQWAGPEGRAIVEETIKFLRGRGVRRIYLSGLSAGGIGASMIAPALGDEISGLILISGTSGGAKPPGVPVLVVHGEQDGMVSVGPARRLAKAMGERGTFRGLEGGHFVFLEQHKVVRQYIEAWLTARETEITP